MEVTPFTCVGDWHGAPVAPVGRREWEDIRQRPSLAELCRLIEAGNEELKRRLPVWTPHCSQFRNNHRSIADAERPLQRLMLDFDEKGHSMEILEKSRQLQEEGKWKILLVEESVRRGTHVLIALPEGMSAEEAQKRFSHDVGFQADAAVKDVSRCIYMVPMEHTLYMCQELFEVGEESIKNEELRMMNEELNDKHKEEKNSSFPTSFKGTPYTDIIAEWFRRKGGEPVEGERNDKLFRLAVQLRCITDRNEAHLLEIMPRYGLSEEEMKNIIHSACTTRYSGMSRFMESILRTLSAEPEAEEGAPEVSTFYIASESPPPMPPLKQCPPLIRLLLSNTPDIYCPAVAHAVFPALGAHLWRTYFPYIDNVLHEATFMNVLIAPTASGKSCINEPVNRIMADIRERDRANLQREKEWKKEVVSKGANKDKRGRPEGLVIQEIDPDMTNAAFVQRLADADGRFLYARMNEIDQFDALKTSAKSKAHFQIMCLAFDPGNTYGQVRVGLNSVCERVSIRFNWNASTTEHKGRSYFRSALTDGPISRINFCTIPERAIGSPMPVYGTYDAAFDEKLRPYIECLNRSQGIVRCRQAQQLATKLVGENADFARLSQSRVFENLSFRATVIAYLKAMVLYVAHGSKWDKSIERFVRWSLHYDLWCKMKYFGAQIEEEEMQDLGKHKRPGPQNLLDLLPDEFTRDEAQEMRKRHRVVRGSLSLMLCNWKGRGYIEPVDTETPLAEGLQRFRKTPEYLKRKLEDT